MKILSVFTVSAFLLFAVSCAEQADKPADTGAISEADSAPESPDTICFLHTGGSHNQDTDMVKLIIDGEKVTGVMRYLPAEKDRRTGSISGSKNGEDIKLKWQYSQEGMDQSTEVVFKLSDGVLSQKQSAYNTETGAEFVPDTAAYRVHYQRVDCSRIPASEI